MNRLNSLKQLSLLVAFWILRGKFFRLSPQSRSQILENLLEGVLLLDQDQVIVGASPALLRLLAWDSLPTGRHIAQVHSELAEWLAAGQPGSLEITQPEKEARLLQFTLVKLEHHQGRPLGAAVFVRNITCQAQAREELRESEERFRMLVENQGEGIGVIDKNHRFIFANPAAERMLCVAPGTLIGSLIDSVLPPHLHALLKRQLENSPDRVIRGFEMPYHRPDGQDVVLEVSASPQFHADGSYYATFAIIRDVTGRKQAEAALVARQRYLSLLNEITSAALEASDLQAMLQTLADRMGELLYADGCYITLWDEEIQRTIPAAAYGPMREIYRKNIVAHPGEITMTESVLKAGQALVAEDVFNTPYLSPHIAQGFPTRSLLGLPLIAGGHKLGAALIAFDTHHKFTEEEISMGEQAARHVALAVFKGRLLEDARLSRDETEAANHRLQRAMNDLDYLATTDKLTGAYNRYKFDEIFSREFSRFDRYQNPLALMMFDMDHFKNVNDNYGHHAGDLVLAEMGRLVRSNIRETDTLTRWGGEEFIILAPGIDMDQALLMGEKIRKLIAESEPMASMGVSISVGLTAALPGDTLETIVRRADNALYLAKHNGRNRVEVVY